MNVAGLVAILLGIAVVLAVLLWLAAVVFVLIDATQRRADHPLLWTLGTLFTGPAGFIAYLIDRPKARRVECGFCGHTILVTDVNCPYCNRSRARLPASRTQQHQEQRRRLNDAERPPGGSP